MLQRAIYLHLVAVTCNTSLSCIIKGSFNNCSVALPAIALLLNIVNLSADAGSPLNKSTVILLPLFVSSQTNIDFTIALELDATVYKVVTVLVVKSNFDFYIYLPFILIRTTYIFLESSFKLC